MAPPNEQVAASAFSRAATLYDLEESGNAIARWTRRRSLAILRNAFGQAGRVLELGCGTGTEAIALASAGLSVVATDAAEGMIKVLKAKLERDPAGKLQQRITPLVMPASRAAMLVERFGRGGFHGAYSSFGALNCEPDLAPVAEALADLVRPGGPVIISLINRYCLWETGWYLLRGCPALAFRRWGGSADATVRPEWPALRVRVYYPRISSVEAAFSPTFLPVRRIGLPWLLPPQGLDHLVRRAPRFFSAVAKVDRRLAASWPCYLIGDHVLLHFVRRD